MQEYHLTSLLHMACYAVLDTCILDSDNWREVIYVLLSQFATSIPVWGQHAIIEILKYISST